jgi:hypothetical protein
MPNRIFQVTTVNVSLFGGETRVFAVYSLADSLLENSVTNGSQLAISKIKNEHISADL